MESHRGSDSRTIQTFHDYLLRMEALVVSVRDSGTPPVEVRGPTDSQLREGANALRTQVELTAATMRSHHAALTSELGGKLRSAKVALAQRLDAAGGRAPTLENRVSTVEQ
eukprot:5792455-Pyramimonas_sp.AAC.1